jgi:thiamine-phosphate pyrophosphorylase
MKLAVISPEIDLPDEHAVVSAMFDEGLERYHLRKPRWSVSQFTAWLSELHPVWRPLVVIHQHHQIAPLLGVGGRHWPENEAPAIPPFVGGSASRSCHTLAALAVSLGCYDSVLVSPLFTSLSKPGHGPSGKLPEQELKTLLTERTDAERRTMVYALGGVTGENVARCAELGFDGVAVIGAVWQAANPVQAFIHLKSTLVFYAL